MPSLQALAGRLMRCPAAPYHEGGVVDEVTAICREYRLAMEIDVFGNILISVKRASKGRPFILAAHLDHPGFIIRRRCGPKSLEAEFLGGVGDSYFQPGVPLRLYPGGQPGVLGQRLDKSTKVFEITAVTDERPAFAVWELPDFNLDRDTIIGRACDDLIGAATILHVLISLALAKARVNVVGVLSRAEEVGFHGALALAASGKLPKDALIVSLETSRELPPARMGQGVIIRVGDRASVFGAAESRFLAEVAADLAKEDSKFQFQRALMSGGTCEATAYQELGYRCAAVCVALGNYHNCGDDNRIAPEFVSLRDSESMSALLRRCALEMKNWRKLMGRLPSRLEGYLREARKRLRAQKLNGKR